MRSGKKKGSSPASKRTRTVAKPKSAPSKAKRSAPKVPAQAKRQTKTPSTKRTAKKVYEKPMALTPVKIKNYRDNKGGHPHVIVDDIDDKHISLGLTKDKYKGKNATNYKCQTSPLGDGKESYMHRQAQVKPKGQYYRPRDGMMEIGDYNRAQEYGERAKKKYLGKKE